MNVCVCVWFRMCVECFLLTNAGYNAPHANQQPQCITWVALLASTPSICWFHNFLILDPKLLSLFFTPPNPRTINIHYAYINTFVRVFLRVHTVYYLLCLLSVLMKIVTHISHAHTDSLFSLSLSLTHSCIHTHAYTFVQALAHAHTQSHTLFSSILSTIKNRHLVGQKNYFHSRANWLVISDVCCFWCRKH